jgi:hypothetical protein
MTNEELDEATADEAWRLLDEGQDVALIAARLAREGWTPPEPVDPDLVAVREIVAVAFENANSTATAKGARLGTYDAEPLVLAALAAYKAGRAAR